MRYTYEPFGKGTCAPDSLDCTIANPWRFLGALGVYQDATGFYKIGTRYYDSSLGRFTQPDPVPGGGLNSYDYGDQDPINMIDTDGELSRPCLTCVGRKIAKSIGSAVRTTVAAGGRAVSWTWRTGKAVVSWTAKNIRVAIKACPWPMCRWIVRVVARYGTFTAGLAASCGLGLYGVYKAGRAGNWRAAAATAAWAALPCGLLVAAAAPK